MEIVDPADVDASGEGLESAEVNRRASFNVDIGRNGSARDLKVHIRCTLRSLMFAFFIHCSSFVVIISRGLQPLSEDTYKFRNTSF